MSIRELLNEKKRIVVKVGSSSLLHPETGDLDYIKLEVLVRELCDLRNCGKDVVLVTSGAVAQGRKAVGMKERPTEIATKQACAAIGQARLMTTYQKLFSEYNHIAAQLLITRNTFVLQPNRTNAKNTFSCLFDLGVIPIVNENDTISTYELEKEIGDNDTLSAIVAALTEADLLILLSDIDGMFTDDPRQNPDAKLIPQIDSLSDEILSMAKQSTGSNVGTGGMNTKLVAAQIATNSGCDMVIANAKDMHIIHQIVGGEDVGTLFVAKKDENFDLVEFVNGLHK